MYERRDVLARIGGATLAVAGGASLPAAAEDGEAKVRVAHAVPDAPAVDVLVNGDVAVAGAEFGDVTGYLELPAGEYDVAINVAGTDSTVFDTTLAVEGEDYTVAATGNLNPEGDEPGFGLDVFEDKLGRLFGDDGRVRAVHLSPDAPAVDVAVAGADDEPAVFLAQGIEFGEAGPNVEVAAGTYPVAVYPAGATDPVFGPVDVEVREGEVLTAFAEGELDPEGDEAAFAPVLAYEEAAPFGDGGGGPPGGSPGRGNRGGN
jgi:hypothetical protein